MFWAGGFVWVESLNCCRIERGPFFLAIFGLGDDDDDLESTEETEGPVFCWPNGNSTTAKIFEKRSASSGSVSGSLSEEDSSWFRGGFIFVSLKKREPPTSDRTSSSSGAFAFLFSTS